MKTNKLSSFEEVLIRFEEEWEWNFCLMLFSLKGMKTISRSNPTLDDSYFFSGTDYLLSATERSSGDLMGILKIHEGGDIKEGNKIISFQEYLKRQGISPTEFGEIHSRFQKLVLRAYFKTILYYLLSVFTGSLFVIATLVAIHSLLILPGGGTFLDILLFFWGAFLAYVSSRLFLKTRNLVEENYALYKEKSSGKTKRKIKLRIFYLFALTWFFYMLLFW